MQRYSPMSMQTPISFITLGWWNLDIFRLSNVMKLIGVCIDMGEYLYVVIPYMIHGSLQTHLKKRKAGLTIDNAHNTELVSISAETLIISLCA